MKNLARILPDFGTQFASKTVTVTDVSLEEQKLESYEAGYQAGWDDSAAANRESRNQVSADFSQNMRDLSMTYHEAQSALLADLKPLLTQIVETVLPELAKDTLAPRIVELIDAEITKGHRGAIVLSAASVDHGLLQPMVDAFDGGLDLELRADETLASGQIRLSCGADHEQELDTTALIDGIQNAVHGFFNSLDGHASEPDGETTMKETA